MKHEACRKPFDAGYYLRWGGEKSEKEERRNTVVLGVCILACRSLGWVVAGKSSAESGSFIKPSLAVSYRIQVIDSH